jgi:putative mRNA 3-end processing factor
MLELRKEGLYCPAGHFFIDPWKPVSHAIITHAHSDHAKAGHKQYLCHHLTTSILEKRLGKFFYQGIEWGQPIVHKGVRISLHPAGHIAGSSQIRIEHKGEVWVVSGDYKTENDGISGALEPVKCHNFITESTFGLPVYKWEDQNKIYDQMQKWVSRNKEQGCHSIFFAYSLGKAQRVAQAISKVTDNIILHGSVFEMHSLLKEKGMQLPDVVHHASFNKEKLNNPSVIIAPMSAMNTPWLKKFTPYKTAICSGWMQIRGHAKRQDCDKGFVLSDHADWDGLLSTIHQTGAERVFATHGFTHVLSRYLKDKGIDAVEMSAGLTKDISETSITNHLSHNQEDE